MSVSHLSDRNVTVIVPGGAERPGVLMVPMDVELPALERIEKMARDMIEPLSVMVGQAELLLDDDVNPQERRKRAEAIQTAGREIERMLRIVAETARAKQKPAQLTLF